MEISPHLGSSSTPRGSEFHAVRVAAIHEWRRSTRTVLDHRQQQQQQRQPPPHPPRRAGFPGRAARRRSCIGEKNPSDHNPPAGEGGRPLQRRSRRPVPLRAAPRDPKEMGERRGGLRRRWASAGEG
ncbi:unnamed protein product [Lampetra planeri]